MPCCSIQHRVLNGPEAASTNQLGFVILLSLTPQACSTCGSRQHKQSFTQSCEVSWHDVQEGPRVSGPASAKLKRFAAALKLDDKHHTALVQSAAAHNMEVGNFGCVCMLPFCLSQLLFVSFCTVEMQHSATAWYPVQVPRMTRSLNMQGCMQTTNEHAIALAKTAATLLSVFVFSLP